MCSLVSGLDSLSNSIFLSIALILYFSVIGNESLGTIITKTAFVKFSLEKNILKTEFLYVISVS